MKSGKLLLVVSLTIGLLLRIVNLGTNPIHLTPDEAALGYNAFSILKTGRDEYGKWFPIIFKSFGDYKPGLYIYVAIPVIATFGLTEFSIRLPSAFAGVTAIWIIALIAEELFKGAHIIVGKLNIKFSHLCALFLAISPWHIHLSRGAWETNLVLTITLLGIFFYLRKKIYLSALFFALTLWGYQGAKLTTLLTLASLLISFPQIVLQNIRKSTKAAVILVVISLPIILSLKDGSGRLKIFSLFSYRRSMAETMDIARTDKNYIKYLLFHNEAIYQFRNILLRYFNYFSGKFLFFDGDWANPRHATPYHGVMYIVDGLFLIIGIIQLSHSSSGSNKFLLLWALLSPLPGALSRDMVHAVRTLNLVAPLALISTYGILCFCNKDKFSSAKVFAISIIYALSLIRFIDLEFVHSPKLFGKYWYYGYKQLVETIQPLKNQFDRIVINQTYDQPYIYFLFYSQYDPHKWWPQAHLRESQNGDVGLVEKLDNIEFRPLAWTGDKYIHKAIIAGNPLSMDPDANYQTDVTLIREIHNPDGTPALYIFQSDK